MSLISKLKCLLLVCGAAACVLPGGRDNSPNSGSGSLDDDEDDEDGDEAGDPDDDDNDDGVSTGADDDDGAGPGDGPKLDVGNDSGSPENCDPGEHEPCDDESNTLDNAVGLGCPGELSVTFKTDGSDVALGVRESFGPTGEWDPIEGSKFVVLGTGAVDELDEVYDPLGDDFFMPCNFDLGPDFDPGDALPAPIDTTPVDGDCEADPSLVGTGDCSGSIDEQFTQGMSANDYTHIEVKAHAPHTATSIGYSFAFFSTEYPVYYGTEFNDLFVGWLESEAWTGNISFDEMGNPISLNAGFLDFKDDDESVEELSGTCMQGHAGTKWLSTTAPVMGGEEVTLILAIFDLSDSQLDSYAFVDNIHFGCEYGPPQTHPAG